MKLTSICQNIRKTAMPVCTALMLLPAQVAQTPTIKLLKSYEQCAGVIAGIKPIEKLSPKILEGLEVVADTNFKGGIVHRYTDEAVKILKTKIIKPQYMIKYKAPVENAKNVYTEPFGMYFANRPDGDLVRPHLGLDIFVSKLSRKPKEPVTIQAPVDGVVIAYKRARKEDNVIGNYVKMLGVDGRQYGFDHMARPTDYKDSIPMPTVGTILKAGDPIGYVGHTGETALWHLHFTVMTDEMKEKQLHSKFWLDMSQKTGYCNLGGQVNPLDEKAAGPIAKLLKEYKFNNVQPKKH